MRLRPQSLELVLLPESQELHHTRQTRSLPPMLGPGGAPLTTEQCLLGLRLAVLGSTPDERHPLGELGGAAPATRTRLSEEEKERVRLAGLF